MKSVRNRVRMPSATSVVARSYPDRIIGIENELPWHLGSDLKQFKKRTSGHAIIMGRKTYESIGRPLPNRKNIVLSRNEIQEKENLYWAKDYRTALMLADYHSIILGKKDFFVVGGEIIYNLFEKYINKVFLTDVFSGPINGDAKFDLEFPIDEWWTPNEQEYPKSEVDDFAFRVTCWMRRKPVHRLRLKQDLMKHDPSIKDKIEQFDSYMTEVQEVEKQPLEVEEVQFELFP